MMNRQLIERAEILKSQISVLKNQLSATTSDIGDWKIAKYQEYSLAGLEIPYDIAELHAQRQAVRDRINELQQELINIK